MQKATTLRQSMFQRISSARPSSNTTPAPASHQSVEAYHARLIGLQMKAKQLQEDAIAVKLERARDKAHVYRLDSTPPALEVPEPYSDPVSFRSSHRSRSSSPVHYRGSPEGTESDLRSPSPDSPSSINSRRNTFGEVENREIAPRTDDPMNMHSVQLPPPTALENRSARAYIDQPTRKSKTKETFTVPPINGIARKKGVAPPYDSGRLSPSKKDGKNLDTERVLVLGTDFKFRDISLRDVARGMPNTQIQSYGKKFKVKGLSAIRPELHVKPSGKQ